MDKLTTVNYTRLALHHAVTGVWCRYCHWAWVGQLAALDRFMARPAVGVE